MKCSSLVYLSMSRKLISWFCLLRLGGNFKRDVLLIAMKIRFLYFEKRWFAKKKTMKQALKFYLHNNKIYPIFLQAYLNFRSKGLLYTCISTYYNYAHISMIIFSLNLYDLTIFLLDYFVVVEVYIGPRDGFHQSCR